MQWNSIPSPRYPEIVMSELAPRNSVIEREVNYDQGCNIKCTTSVVTLVMEALRIICKEKRLILSNEEFERSGELH